LKYHKPVTNGVDGSGALRLLAHCRNAFYQRELCDHPDSGWERCGDLGDGAARGEGGDGMIRVPAGIRVLVATKPVDFRRGADSLAALVREQLKHDPFSGTIYIFRSKRADRLKILAWDGSGLVLFWKRLEHGAFRWPPISDGVMRLSASQLAALVDGMDWSRLYARDIAQPTATS
jgi:transposase